MSWRRPQVSITIMLVVVWALTGCSATKLAYNQADWYLTREVSKVFCPTSEQRDALKREVVSFMRWHRRHELPLYAKDLRRLARGLERPVSRKLFDDAVAVVDRAWARAKRRLARPLVALGARLGTKQVACLAVKLRRDHDETLKELEASEDAFRARRADKVVDTVEKWVGDLSGSQRKKVRAAVGGRRAARSEARAQLNAGRRVAAVLGRRDASYKQTWLKAVFGRRYATFTTAERELMLRRDRRRRRMIRDLAVTLDASQRGRLKRKLLSFAEDFEALARQ
jgi:hypothetical protein